MYKRSILAPTIHWNWYIGSFMRIGLARDCARPLQRNHSCPDSSSSQTTRFFTRSPLKCSCGYDSLVFTCILTSRQALIPYCNAALPSFVDRIFAPNPGRTLCSWRSSLLIMSSASDLSIGWLPVEVAKLILDRLSPIENCQLSQVRGLSLTAFVPQWLQFQVHELTGWPI